MAGTNNNPPIVPADAPPTSSVTLMRTTALANYLAAVQSAIVLAPPASPLDKNSGGTTGGTKTINDGLLGTAPTFTLDRYTLSGGVLACVEVVQAVYRTSADATNSHGQTYTAYDYRVFVALAVQKATPPGGSVVCYEWVVDPLMEDPNPFDATLGAFGCPLWKTWTRCPVK